MNRYEPVVPRLRFGAAAVIMATLTFGLMIVLPSKLETDANALAMRAEARESAAAAGTLHLRCTVPPAFNAPLFPTARENEVDTRCKEPS